MIPPLETRWHTSIRYGPGQHKVLKSPALAADEACREAVLRFRDEFPDRHILNITMIPANAPQLEIEGVPG